MRVFVFMCLCGLADVQNRPIAQWCRREVPEEVIHHRPLKHFNEVLRWLFFVRGKVEKGTGETTTPSLCKFIFGLGFRYYIWLVRKLQSRTFKIFFRFRRWNKVPWFYSADANKPRHFVDLKSAFINSFRIGVTSTKSSF